MLKGEAPLDHGVVAEKARHLSDHAEKIPALTPEDSNEPPSEALPIIWEDWGGQVEAFFAHLPAEVAKRELDAIGARLDLHENDLMMREVRSDGPGNALIVSMEHDLGAEVVAEFGMHGRSAEKVTAMAARGGGFHGRQGGDRSSSRRSADRAHGASRRREVLHDPAEPAQHRHR